MTSPHQHHDGAPGRPEAGDEEPPAGGRGHHWLMIACGIPMIAIAGAIALSGAGLGFFVVAVMCTAMMALMIAGMSNRGSDDGH